MKTYNGLKAKPYRFLCYSTIFFACNVNGQIYTCKKLDMESFNKTDNRLVLTELYEVGNPGPGLRRNTKI